MGAPSGCKRLGSVEDGHHTFTLGSLQRPHPPTQGTGPLPVSLTLTGRPRSAPSWPPSKPGLWWRLSHTPRGFPELVMNHDPQTVHPEPPAARPPSAPSGLPRCSALGLFLPQDPQGRPTAHPQYTQPRGSRARLSPGSPCCPQPASCPLCLGRGGLVLRLQPPDPELPEGSPRAEESRCVRGAREQAKRGEGTDRPPACSGRARGPPGVHGDRDLGNQGSPGLGAKAARHATAPGWREAWRTARSTAWGRAGQWTGARPEELLAGLRAHAQLRGGAGSRPLRWPGHPQPPQSPAQTSLLTACPAAPACLAQRPARKLPLAPWEPIPPQQPQLPAGGS